MVFQQIFSHITLIQLIIMAFAFFAWSRALLRLRGKAITLREFLFWSVVWAAVVFVAISPDILWNISEILGVGRAVDTVVYVSIIVLFYLVFRMYVIIDAKNREITSIVREIAIRDATTKASGNTPKRPGKNSRRK